MNKKRIHPGVALRKVLKEQNITQKELANKTGISVTTIGEVINGKRSISEKTAEGIALATGTLKQKWLNLQAEYEGRFEDVLPFDKKIVDGHEEYEDLEEFDDEEDEDIMSYEEFLESDILERYDNIFEGMEALKKADLKLFTNMTIEEYENYFSNGPVYSIFLCHDIREISDSIRLYGFNKKEIKKNEKKIKKGLPILEKNTDIKDTLSYIHPSTFERVFIKQDFPIDIEEFLND